MMLKLIKLARYAVEGASAERDLANHRAHDEGVSHAERGKARRRVEHLDAMILELQECVRVLRRKRNASIREHSGGVLSAIQEAASQRRRTTNAARRSRRYRILSRNNTRRRRRRLEVVRCG